MDRLSEKYERLREYLTALGSAAVAFSGGADSSFLLAAAHQALGDKAFAVTVRSPLVPEREAAEAVNFCSGRGIRQLFYDFTDISPIRSNPADRCYICKRMIFEGIMSIARRYGAEVMEGTNLDDESDYRPGMRALAELHVKSPLRELGFTKAEIRELSRRLGLPTADKPSAACLASRFAYGEVLSEERLAAVGKAEELLRDMGFGCVRVRVSGASARIEVPSEDIPRLAACRSEFVSRIKELGFTYVSADLEGYRTGSMNEEL